MSEDRSFSGREIAAALTFVVLAGATALVSYRSGLNVAGGGGGAEIVAPVAGAPVNGQALYVNNCAGCHGAQGQGGVGPGLTASAGWPEADFQAAVLHGKGQGGRTLAPVMPRFAETGLDGEEATPEQIDAIHAYVKGL